LKARHVEHKSLVNQPNGSNTLTIKKNITPVTDGKMTIKYFKDKIVITKKED